MIDARAWAQLDAGEKAALHDATEQGLGLLLRADTPLAAQTIADWHDLGFTVLATKPPASITIDHYLGLRDRPAFDAAGTTFSAPTSIVQFKADDGSPLSWWHAQGRGASCSATAAE